MDAPRFLDQTLFAELAGKAAANPRGRQHHNFHQMEDACHRMAVGLQPSTYIPPHRHLGDNKAETLLVLKGRLGVLIFDETGAVLSKTVLQAGGDCVGVDLPTGVFHGLVVLEADSLMFDARPVLTAPVGQRGELARMGASQRRALWSELLGWMHDNWIDVHVCEQAPPRVCALNHFLSP
jgi:cupin fold WbuC family metalloprotein